LCCCDALRIGKSADAIAQSPIGVEVLSREAWAATPEVTLIKFVG